VIAHISIFGHLHKNLLLLLLLLNSNNFLL